MTPLPLLIRYNKKEQSSREVCFSWKDELPPLFEVGRA